MDVTPDEFTFFRIENGMTDIDVSETLLQCLERAARDPGYPSPGIRKICFYSEQQVSLHGKQFFI